MPSEVIHIETTDGARTAHRDISGRDAEMVGQLLSDGADAVVWLPEWLCEEKPLEYAHGHAQVARVRIDRETEKAWGVKQAGRNDVVWLPKSQAVAFRTADGAAEVSSTQARLGDR